MKIKQILISIVASSAIFGGILAVTPTATTTNQVSAAVTKAKVQPNAQPKSVMLPANWWGPSESVPYPNVAQHPKMWIHVSLAKQRVYLMDGGKTLYTMYASTGLPKRGWGPHLKVPSSFNANAASHFLKAVVVDVSVPTTSSHSKTTGSTYSTQFPLTTAATSCLSQRVLKVSTLHHTVASTYH